MDLEREKKFHELLAQATELEPEARHAFVAASCGDDRDLLEEVLQAASEDDGSLDDFLENPAMRSPTDLTYLLSPTQKARGQDSDSSIDFDQGQEMPGQVGPYTLLDVLGEGGMGRVFLAEQQHPVRRRVALKLMHASLAGAHAHARFDAERQALARLTHPHIGHILDAGTTAEGQPYFAMELVVGVQINRYCDRQRLSLRQRLELMMAVCRGVEHAHQKQILHRDIKPSNLLVTEIDGRPVPKIIDFGIAKALDDPLTENTLLTGDQMIGTPSYMSPEAIDSTLGDIDTRSDVYALGIVLYESLAGTRPFDSQDDSIVKIAGRVLKEAAAAPSARFAALEAPQKTKIAQARGLSVAKLERQLRQDLDAIVLKAIAKNRDDRYGSATELATDLESYLQHRPVSAGSSSWSHQLIKLVRRHRAAVIASSLAMVMFIAGVVGISLALYEARRAENRARQESNDARRARQEAEQVVDFLTDLFKDSDPFSDSQTTTRSSDALSARELVDRGAERIDAQLADQPLVQVRMKRAISQVYLSLALFEPAQRLLEGAIDILERQPPEARQDLAALHYRWAVVAHHRGLLDEAERALHYALEILERRGQPDPVLRSDILESFSMLKRGGGDYAAAERFAAESLELRESLADEDPQRVASSLNTLANVYLEQARFADAEALYRRTLDLQRPTKDKAHPAVVQTLNNLAVAVAQQGHLAEAAPIFAEALDLRQEILGEDHPQVAQSLNNLAVLYADLGRFADAEALHRRALDIRQRAFGDEHSAVAWSLDNLGVVTRDLERYDDAETYARRALAIRQSLFGAEHPLVARSLFQVGSLQERQGRLEPARQLFEQALAIRRRTLEDQHPDLARNYWRLGALLWRLGDTERGDEHMQRGLTILAANPERNADELAEARAVRDELLASP